MTRKNQTTMSSRELLARIGLDEESLGNLIEDEPLEDLGGDLGAALRSRYQSFNTPHAFRPGDLVTWKAGMKNRLAPRYGHPVIVLSVLDQPVYDTEQESGCTYFREPLDLVLGLIWDRDPGRGEFVTFHYDSRRFQPWTADD